MRVQAKINDEILENLCGTFGGSKGIKFYISYLKTGKTGNKLADLYLKDNIKVQPKQNTEDCDKKIKRMQKIMEDREASADETIDKMGERLEEKDKTIGQLELKIYNLENELEEQKENKPKDTSKEGYKLWIMALYKSIYYRQELVKYDDDAVLARNLGYDIKLFKSYFGVEPDRKNLDDLDKLVDHYLTYKKNR